MDRRAKLLSGLDVARRRGVEFGPLASPIVARTEGDISYVDHLDTDALRRKYAGLPHIDAAAIAHVDIVSDGQDLRASLAQAGPFDYVLASHVIEHVPNLVGWLADLAASLTPGGEVRVAVPDMRYCFDLLRRPSAVADVLAAHVQDARRPSAHQILDFCLHKTPDFVPARAWRGELAADIAPTAYTFAEAVRLAREAHARGAYHDVHCWTFTPATFVEICAVLAEQALLPFACAALHDTEVDTYEFFVVLTLCDDPAFAAASWRRRGDDLAAPPALAQSRAPTERALRAAVGAGLRATRRSARAAMLRAGGRVAHLLS